jgi:iron complex transport system substrate-binding protein
MRHYITLFLLIVLVLASVISSAFAQDDEFPLTIVDETGTELTFEAPVETVLCLSIACLDHLYQLDLAPVGMTDLLVMPYEQYFGELDEDMTIIEGGMQPDLEQIAELAPDLIIGQAGFFDALREPLAGVAPLYLAFPNDVDETLTELRDVGAMTGRTEAADAAIVAFTEKFEAYQADAPGDASVMIVFGAAEADAMFIEAANGQTCQMFEGLAECPFELPEGAGGMAAFGYDNFSFEKILEVDPDVIFFAGYNPDRSANNEVMQQLNANLLWAALSAVEEEHIYGIEP